MESRAKNKNSFMAEMEAHRIQRDQRRAQKKRMYRVKIEVRMNRKLTCDSIEKKIYFRDATEADACVEKYRQLLSNAIDGTATFVDIEGEIVSAAAILGYKVKVRKPEIDPEIPAKPGDDEND